MYRRAMTNNVGTCHNRSSKNLLRILLSAAVLLTFVGCSGGDNEAPTGSDSNNDTTAQIISDVLVTRIISTSVTVSWTTNEASSTQVQYGSTASYGSIADGATNVTSHGVTLNNLTANTLYHYRVMSADGAGHSASSADATFTTAAPETAPVVGQITIIGTFVHGSQVTLTGTNFGVKSPARPLVWATFEPGQGAGGNDRNPTSQGRRAGWDNFQSASSLSSARVPANSSQALRMDMARDIGWPSDGAPDDFADSFGAQISLAPADAGVMYYRGKAYKDWDITQICQQYAVCSINDKMWRTWRVGVNQPINFYSAWHHIGDGRDGRVTTENAGDNSPCSMWNDLPYPFHQWNTEEWLYRRSSGANVSDGVLRFAMNNVVYAEMLGCVNLTSADSSGPTDFGIYEDFANVPNISPRPVGWWTYFKDVYIDNTWARVLIGNSVNPSNATQTEIQIPVAWSDTSIAIEANRGEIAGFSGMSVFVYNAQNQLIGSAQIP